MIPHCGHDDDCWFVVTEHNGAFEGPSFVKCFDCVREAVQELQQHNRITIERIDG